MSRGQLQCLGTSQFLKREFGSGYRFFATMQHGVLHLEEGGKGSGGEITNLASVDLERHPLVSKIIAFASGHVPGATFAPAESSAASLCLILPFSSAQFFPGFFSALDECMSDFCITGYGVAITSLEEVFLKTGGDHDLQGDDATLLTGSAEADQIEESIDGSVAEDFTDDAAIHLQVYAIWRRRLSQAVNDPRRTLPFLGFPLVVGTTGILLNVFGVLGDPGDGVSGLVMSLVIAAGYLPVVSIISEGVVAERTTQLRNVLTVMGCDPRSYWLGTFVGDFTLLSLLAVTLYVVALICAYVDPPVKGGYKGDDDYLEPLVDYGRLLWLLLVFSVQLSFFCYMLSFFFTSPKVAIATMPFFSIVLIFLPVIFVALFWYGVGPEGADLIYFADNTIALNMIRGVAVCSPHGALCAGLLAISNTCEGVSSDQCVVPPYWQTMTILAGEAVLFALATFLIDRRDFLSLEEQRWDLPESDVKALDADVAAERELVLASAPEAFALRLAALRKLFPSKRLNDPPFEAVKSLSLGLKRGELFGLLGANGAGKTTAISCVMRVLYPNAGSMHIEGHSVSNDFTAASRHLGVVTQHNTLWENLSCIDHLRLFARLRGVPKAKLEALVTHTVDQMELGPYQHRLAGQLSGGMKRKLCVAVAIIGDPDVVMLDEPSAGLDPVSRRNLWNTLIKTMGTRAVLLTTHSMEEAEALCTRIGIMVKGQLQALGSPQHLKMKFGSG